MVYKCLFTGSSLSSVLTKLYKYLTTQLFIMADKLKTNYFFSFLIGVIVILVIILGFIFMNNSKSNNSSTQDEIKYDIIKSEDESNLLSFVYNCNTNTIAKEIECDGTANYIGPNDQWVEADLGLFCYKENPNDASGKCTVDADSFNLGQMDSNRNQVPFQVRCGYDYDDNNFNVKIGFRTHGILPQDCSSQGL